MHSMNGSSICRRERAQSGPALHHSVDLKIQTYTEPVPFQHGKLTTKCPWDRYFYSVAVPSNVGLGLVCIKQAQTANKAIVDIQNSPPYGPLVRQFE